MGSYTTPPPFLQMRSDPVAHILNPESTKSRQQQHSSHQYSLLRFYHHSSDCSYYQKPFATLLHFSVEKQKGCEVSPHAEKIPFININMTFITNPFKTTVVASLWYWENSITRRTGRSEPIRNFDYCEVDLWQSGRILLRALVVNGVGDGL